MFAAYGSNKHLAAAIRQARQAGDTEFLAEHDLPAVKVPEQWKLYFTAFLKLEGERVDSLSHIPWSRVVMYCHFYGLNTDQTEWMIEIIERVDNAVIEKRQKEAKRNDRSARTRE